MNKKQLSKVLVLLSIMVRNQLFLLEVARLFYIKTNSPSSQHVRPVTNCFEEAVKTLDEASQFLQDDKLFEEFINDNI